MRFKGRTYLIVTCMGVRLDSQRFSIGAHAARLPSLDILKVN